MSHARRNDEQRVCARDGCNVSMKYRRESALYCSGACRTAAYRENARETAQAASVTSHIEVAALSQRFWTGYRAIRRTDLRQRWQRAALEEREGRG